MEDGSYKFIVVIKTVDNCPDVVIKLCVVSVKMALSVLK